MPQFCLLLAFSTCMTMKVFRALIRLDFDRLSPLTIELASFECLKSEIVAFFFLHLPLTLLCLSQRSDHGPLATCLLCPTASLFIQDYLLWLEGWVGRSHDT